MQFSIGRYTYLTVIFGVLCLSAVPESPAFPSSLPTSPGEPFTFGTSFVHWQGAVGNLTDVSFAKALGLTAVRIHSWSVWKEVEYERGKYNWKWLDDRVSNLLTPNIRVYIETPSLQPEGVPEWAGDISVNTKSIVNDLLKFTDAMVNRYSGKVSYWQMGNEIDWLKETSTWLTVDSMDSYFRSTFQIIKQCDPNAKIVINSAQGTSRVANFFQGLISRGVSFDIVGIDPYVATAEQTGWDSSPESYLRSNVEAVLGFQKPILITEIGVYWGTPYPVNFEAEMLRRSFSVLKEYPQVVGAFWYPYETMMYSPWYWFGLADPKQGTVTPVYDTYKSTIELWNTAIVTSSTTIASTTSTWTTTTTSTSTTTTTSTSSTVSTTTSTTPTATVSSTTTSTISSTTLPSTTTSSTTATSQATTASATSTTRTSSALVTNSVTVYTSRSVTSTGGKQPTTITCDVSRSQDSKLGVRVTGKLTASNVGVPKRDLTIYYSIKGYPGRSVKVTTDSQGNFGTTIYSEVQNTTVNVDKVEFLGDETYLPSTWPRARSGSVTGTAVAAAIPVTAAIAPPCAAE